MNFKKHFFPNKYNLSIAVISFFVSLFQITIISGFAISSKETKWLIVLIIGGILGYLIGSTLSIIVEKVSKKVN